MYYDDDNNDDNTLLGRLTELNRALSQMMRNTSERNIVDSISENERLQKLNEFVIASELSNILLDYENLTLFAPLDDAFAALSAKTYYGYLKEKNKDQLQSLINFHFVEGEFTTENVEDPINTKSINI